MPTPPLPQIRTRVAALIRREGSLLLVRHEKLGRSYWLLPGGGLEFGETLEEAAQREIREETGFEIRVGALTLLWESLPPDRSRHVLNLAFEAEITGGALSVPGDDERLREARFVAHDELASLPMHPPLAAHLVRWLDGTAPPLHLGRLWSDP